MSNDRIMTIEEASGRATLTVEEAASLLGIGRSAAYAAVKAKEIPSVKVGRRVLIPTHTFLCVMLGMDD